MEANRASTAWFHARPAPLNLDCFVGDAASQ
jgi:hypothetical protein